MGLQQGPLLTRGEFTEGFYSKVIGPGFVETLVALPGGKELFAP